MLYLIRHADAVVAEPDAARPLSRTGRAEVRRLVDFFRGGRSLQPEEVWHSPLVRARETAELLAAGLGWTGSRRVEPGLEPDDPPGAVAERIARQPAPLAIVGHNPHLTGLASVLVTGSLHPPVVVFPKGAVLALEPGFDRSPGSWQIVWMVTPQILG